MFSARGRAAPPSVNLGLPHIWDTIRAGNLKFCTHLDGSSALFENGNFPPGASQAAVPDSVNLGPRHISETIRARKLKFYTFR